MKLFIPIILMILLLCPGRVRGQDSSYVNSIGMKFIRIAPGKMWVGKFEPPYPVAEDTITGAERPMAMWMGEGRPYDAEAFAQAKELATRDALPGFEVGISKAYFIGQYEVTQAQWKKVMGDNPSVFQGTAVAAEDDHPVENVTWDDVQKFLARLNEMEKKIYRLPSEFEWEYAARAGAEGDIPWSETQLVAQLGGNTTREVGGKKPNAWGLFDMLGNVWEWVDDYYNEKLFADPRPPLNGKTHVLKGASFTGDVKNATWFTHGGGPGNGWDVGFRIVLEIGEKSNQDR